MLIAAAALKAKRVYPRSRASLRHRGVLLLLLLLAGCNPASQRPSGEKIFVLVAASAADAVREIAIQFEKSQPSVEVVVSAGASNALARQIMAGAPADIFLSAHKKWVDAVAEQAPSDHSVELFANRMVLIVPKGNPACVAKPIDLVGDHVSRVAVAGERVPAGIYAEQALQALRLLDDLRHRGKLARGSDARVTLSYVERGEAEAGVVYATSARLSNQVETVVELDSNLHDPILYHALFLPSADAPRVARLFFQYLKSPRAEAVFRRHGFSPLPQDSSAK